MKNVLEIVGQARSHLADRAQTLISKQLVAQMKEANQGRYVLASIDAHSGDMDLIVDVQRKSQNENRFSLLDLVGGNQRSSGRQDLQVFAPIDVADVGKQLLIRGSEPLFAIDTQFRGKSRVHEDVSTVGVPYPDARGQVAHHE